jgi:hypothetical protein
MYSVGLDVFLVVQVAVTSTATVRAAAFLNHTGSIYSNHRNEEGGLGRGSYCTFFCIKKQIMIYARTLTVLQCTLCIV